MALERLRQPDARGVYKLAVMAGSDGEQGGRALATLSEAGAPVVETLCSIVEETGYAARADYEARDEGEDRSGTGAWEV